MPVHDAPGIGGPAAVVAVGAVAGVLVVTGDVVAGALGTAPGDEGSVQPVTMSNRNVIASVDARSRTSSGYGGAIP